MERRTVLLIDDHALIREGLAAVIDREPDLKVAACAETLREGRAVLGRQRLDLVITDLTLPDGSGLEFVKDVRTQFPRLPILVLSMHDERLYAERALQAGANAYLMKETPASDLLAAMRQAFAGGQQVNDRMSLEILSRMSGDTESGQAPPLSILSDRELQVFELLGHGKSSGEIAQILGMSTRTVDGHRLRIRKKLRLSKEASSLEKKAVRWVECGEYDG